MVLRSKGVGAPTETRLAMLMLDETKQIYVIPMLLGLMDDWTRHPVHRDQIGAGLGCTSSSYTISGYCVGSFLLQGLGHATQCPDQNSQAGDAAAVASPPLT